MFRKTLISILLSSAMLLTLVSCTNAASGSQGSDTESTGTAAENAESDSASEETASREEAEDTAYASAAKPEAEEKNAADAEDSKKDITDSFTIETDTDDGYTLSGSTYTITKGGKYVLSGLLEGNLVIDAEDEEVKLVLSDCRIVSAAASPVTVLNADQVSISAEEGTYSEIDDERQAAASSEETEETLSPETAGAAVYSTCDLTVKGDGALLVSSLNYAGIHSKKDLKIKNLTLKVTSESYGLKGNDSVTADSAELIVVSAGGDGIKTEDSSLSEKGNQKGTVAITNGTVNIYAARDGISAAYNVILSEDAYVGIYTDSYSDYTGDVKAVSGSELYLILSQSDYNEDFDYYACLGKSGSDSVYVKASSLTYVYSGRTMYYGLVLQIPSGYETISFASYQSGASPETDSAVSATETLTINTSMNAYLIQNISDSEMTGGWASYTTNTDSSNGTKQEYSTKGIKAYNEVDIEDNVTLVIYATDDGIHVNGGDTLMNEETGLGNFVMSGGTVQITSGDDGIHADAALTINRGTVIILTSYEGLEGNSITVNGGKTFVYATDDAVNGSTSSSSTAASVTVNGGYLEVETPSGDTDAIDVNGSYQQSGGFVLVKGGSSQGSVAGSVDVDGTITVDGGCIVACGGICESPEGEANAYVSSSTSLSAGDYELKDSSGNTVLSFTLGSAYSSIWIASDALVTGTAYTLTTGETEVLSWTQEEGTMGTAGGMNNGGMNNWGMNRGGGR